MAAHPLSRGSGLTRRGLLSAALVFPLYAALHNRAYAAAAAPSVFFDLPELLLDVRGPNFTRNVLKLRLSAELENERDALILERAIPQVLDAFITMLRFTHLHDLEGAGLSRIQAQLLDLARKRVPGARIRNVLFRELIVQ